MGRPSLGRQISVSIRPIEVAERKKGLGQSAVSGGQVVHVGRVLQAEHRLLCTFASRFRSRALRVAPRLVGEEIRLPARSRLQFIQVSFVENQRLRRVSLQGKYLCAENRL